MARFSINNLMNDPKATAAPQAEGGAPMLIDIAKLKPSKMNKYGIRELEELAANIELVGLLHPLRVREADAGGTHEIISGERRYRALQLLVDEGKTEFAQVPCTLDAEENPLLVELKLISANAQTRDLTDYEKTYQAGRIKEILQALKKEGHDFKGRMREIVADMLKVSPAQVGIMESINKNLAPEVKEQFKEGNLNISAAYQASRLPQEQQKEVLEDMKAQGGKVDAKTVAEKRKAAKPTAAPPPSPEPPPAPPPKPQAKPEPKQEAPRIDRANVIECLQKIAGGFDVGINIAKVCADAAFLLSQEGGGDNAKA